MSLWTCHPAHLLLSYLLIAAGYGLSRAGLGDWTMALVLPAFVMQLNGCFAIAYQSNAKEGRDYSPFVWRLAFLAALIVNALFFLLGLSDAENKTQQVLAITAISILASGQLSFLGQHRPLRNPKSVRNR